VAAVALEVSIALERWELRAARHRKIEPPEMRRGLAVRALEARHCPAVARLERPRQLDERGLTLAGDHALGAVGEEVLRVEAGVEPEEADMAAGTHGAHALRDRHAEPEGRVHGHRDGDQLRARDLVGVEGLHRHVHHRGPVAQALEEGRRPRHRERLMPELVAGNEEDLARLFHRALNLHSRYTRPQGAARAAPSRSVQRYAPRAITVAAIRRAPKKIGMAARSDRSRVSSASG